MCARLTILLLCMYYNICSLLTKQIAIYLPQIWLVISKKAKDATVGAFGSLGDSQSINPSMKKCFISHAGGLPKYVATSMKTDFKEEPNVSILVYIHQLSSHTMPARRL